MEHLQRGLAIREVALCLGDLFQLKLSDGVTTPSPIHVFYNLQRRHSSIRYVSPMEFDLGLQSQKRAA